MTVTAVVPLKALRGAKSRLAGTLAPAERRALTIGMFQRVLAACRASGHVSNVLVVAGDADGLALAAAAGARGLLEPRPGLQAALDAADAALGPVEASLVVAADLPLATAADLDHVCAVGLAGPGPRVVLVATADGGTGALLRRPAAVMGTRYGPGSAGEHVSLAHRLGLDVVVLEVPGLALDVDTEDALREAENLLVSSGCEEFSR